MKIATILLVLVGMTLSFTLMGCQGEGELTKEADQKLRNDVTRDLTPEEKAQLGKGAPADASMKGK